MSELTKTISEIFALPVVATLIGVVVFLYRANITQAEKHQKELAALQEKFLAEKDMRIADATKIAQVTVETQKYVSTITADLKKAAEEAEEAREDRERLEREMQFRDRHTGPEEMRPVGLRPPVKR